MRAGMDDEDEEREMRFMRHGSTRAWLAATASVAALVFAGCGGASSPTAKKTPAGEKVTLTVWDWDYNEELLKPVLERLDKAFEQANPNVTVNHVGVPYDAAPARYRAAIASRQGPDVMTVFTGAYAASFRQGLLPLETMMTAADRSDWRLLDSSVAPDGHTYAVPYGSTDYVFAYNKDLFEQAGITQPPTTWDELLASCKQLRSAGITPIAGGFKDGWYGQDFFLLLSTYLLDDAQRKELYAARLPLNDPKFVEVFKLIKQLADHRCFTAAAEGKVADDTTRLFADRQAAMVLRYTGQGPIEKGGVWDKQLGSALGVFAPPAPPGAPYPRVDVNAPRSGWAITKWSDHPDVAFRYVEFMMSPRAFELGFKLRGMLPNITGYTPRTSYAPTRTYLAMMRWPRSYSVQGALPEGPTDSMNRYMGQLITGDISPQQVADQLEAAMADDRDQLTH